MTLFKKKAVVPSDLDVAIARAHIALLKYDVGTPEYEKVLTHLSALYDIQANQLPEDRVSKDTMASGAFSLSSVLSVIFFEKFGDGIVTSKAMQLLPKIRNR